jgi:acyl-CoA dehydrogenase
MTALDNLYPPTSPLNTPEHQAFRATVRRFVEEEVTPFHTQWERDGQVPREIWKRAGELGLLCLTVPEEYGGAGVDFSYSAIVVEELSRAGATGPIFYLHSDIVAPYLVPRPSTPNGSVTARCRGKSGSAPASSACCA